MLPLTAEILLPKSLWVGGWWVVVVCRPILVFCLSLSQAEQYWVTNLVQYLTQYWFQYWAQYWVQYWVEIGVQDLV